MGSHRAVIAPWILSRCGKGTGHYDLCLNRPKLVRKFRKRIRKEGFVIAKHDHRPSIGRMVLMARIEAYLRLCLKALSLTKVDTSYVWINVWKCQQTSK